MYLPRFGFVQIFVDIGLNIVYNVDVSPKQPHRSLPATMENTILVLAMTTVDTR